MVFIGQRKNNSLLLYPYSEKAEHLLPMELLKITVLYMPSNVKNAKK